MILLPNKIKISFYSYENLRCFYLQCLRGRTRTRTQIQRVSTAIQGAANRQSNSNTLPPSDRREREFVTLLHHAILPEVYARDTIIKHRNEGANLDSLFRRRESDFKVTNVLPCNAAYEQLTFCRILFIVALAPRSYRDLAHQGDLQDFY